MNEGRRDYGRWEAWMGNVILAIVVVVTVASFFAGEFLLGGIGAAMGILYAIRRPR